MDRKNYYKTLGVKENASLEEIKKAYKAQAIKWHPDKNKDNKVEAEAKMKKINEAYSVLSNPKSKREYDSFDGFGESNSNQSYNSFFWGDIDIQNNQKEQTSFFNWFEDIFSGKNTKDGSNYEQPEKETIKYKSDVEIELILDFKESILGTTKKIKYNFIRICKICNGAGVSNPKDVVICNQCSGSGYIESVKKTVLGYIKTQGICNKCSGKGKIIKKLCNGCNGNKVLKKEELIEITIPKGINPEKKLKYNNLGNDIFNTKNKGNLLISIKVKEHIFFTRKQNDIIVEVPISFLTAVLGGKIEYISLEGVENTFIPACSQEGSCISINNKGCYLEINSEKRGDLLLLLKIKLPNKLSEKNRIILEKMQEESSWNPNKDFIIKNSK